MVTTYKHFKSADFSIFQENALVSLIERDDIQMEKLRFEKTRSPTNFTRKTTTNYQDQNNNKTPQDIPNSERQYDMASLKFLSPSMTLGLILQAWAS
ncbi:hypothetical protein F8M41_010348 [Gigaspora margarita]|uniref:Uncharacterized protein n=1 Tax=Gigaspora margarita TaxID=4874 RepID=A0A8H4AUE7_GIGMA|nr:hypothetical protein F8M41_010348 [Gigaspora margarita]